jgi:uncharacterized membrane protein YqaE (UPF0057 family)
VVVFLDKSNVFVMVACIYNVCLFILVLLVGICWAEYYIIF